MNPKDLKIVFFGTPEFAIKPLEALIGAGYEIIAVVTAPDKPKGRKMILTPPPVKTWLMEHKAWNIKIFQPDKLEIGNWELEIGAADLFVIAAYGKMLPKTILQIPKYGTINVHPSLLPRWRGPSPIQAAILSGDKKTGVSIMLVNEKMDEGPILARQELKQSISNSQYPKLHKELSELGSTLLLETAPKWINGEIKPRSQDNLKATYCKIIKKEDGLLKPEEPDEIKERKIRAFTPWPGAYTFLNGKRIIITEAELTNDVLQVKRVKPEGKNEMEYKDYLKGNPPIIFRV